MRGRVWLGQKVLVCQWESLWRGDRAEERGRECWEPLEGNTGGEKTVEWGGGGSGSGGSGGGGGWQTSLELSRRTERGPKGSMSGRIE